MIGLRCFFPKLITAPRCQEPLSPMARCARKTWHSHDSLKGPSLLREFVDVPAGTFNYCTAKITYGLPQPARLYKSKGHLKAPEHA